MNYKELGLKAGLECHQQLNTKKLFCNCESNIPEDLGNFEIFRKLRPVASETGAFEKSALQEFNKGKTYVYNAHKENICLVELDEEPPNELNKDALNTALEVALKCKANIFDNAFIMRKIVIDGSNTSGFQRTALIAQDGFLDIGKKVRVGSICLEEDACQNVESTAHITKYSLERLGIPLIEFTTLPDLETPEEVKECAKKIGELFRITGNAKRGLGSIRQDVNVSIKEGSRVEIKGVQYLDLIDKYVENEIKRQIALIETMKTLNERNLKPKQEFKIYDLTKEMQEIENEKIKESLKKQKALGILLQGFKGILGKETMPGKRIGSEISQYVKTKTKAKGLFHTDELPKYGITEKLMEKINKKLNAEKEDLFIIIIEDEKEAEKALKIAYDRALLLFDGVIKETRNPLPDGTTEYSRPLSGENRMYPETDLPTINIKKEQLKELEKDLPIWYEERINNYMKYGLNKNIAEYVAKTNYARNFSKLVSKYNPLSLADFFMALPEKVNLDNYLWILDSEKENKLIRKDFSNAIKDFENGKTKNEILNALQKSELDGESKLIVNEILKNNKEFIKNHHSPITAMMGTIMKALKEKNKKPDMKQLSEYLEKEIIKYR